MSVVHIPMSIPDRPMNRIITSTVIARTTALLPQHGIAVRDYLHAGLRDRLRDMPAVAPGPTHRSQRPLYFGAPEFRRVGQLLDIGGGPGFVASLLKEENPRIKITIFDLPPVCDFALNIFRESGQDHDLGAHPGDFFRDPYPSGFRAMQYSHVLEFLPPIQAQRLLKKAFAALPARGKLFIYGSTSNIPSERYRMGAENCAHFHCADQYARWLHETGFSSITRRQNDDGRVFLAAVK